MTAAPGRSAARCFLEALFAGKPDELRILLWTLPEKESHWFKTIDDSIKFAESLRGHDLYVGIGLSGRDYGPSRRCPSSEIAGIVGICADLDVLSAAHPNPTLPASTEQALSILPPEFPPSFVIRTGHGLQVWWLFREPYIFSNDADRRAAIALVNRFHALIADNAKQYGWTYERLSDLARVMRVPGTTNCKDPSNPKAVVIESQSDRCYNPSDVADILDHLAVPDPDAETAASREWAQRFDDMQLNVNLSARLPEDRVSTLLTADHRFKETWFRQRRDLRDQSQSGYDLALACFGFDTGLTEQEIVDLIVHHRALHQQKPRTSLDYFQRTISKAAYRSAGNNQFPTFNRSNPGTDVPPRSENDRDSRLGRENNVAANKAAICNRLSEILGVKIHRITKISGQHPIFHMDLAEGKVEFSSVAKLISQTSVRNTLVAITDKLMRRFKPKEWDEIAQALLDACTVEEGGEEMQMESAASLRLVQYLSATPFIDSLKRQNRDTARRPMLADGLITVCASDIQTFSNKTTAENLTIPTVVSMLTAVGAKSKRFRGNFPEQTRWILPPDKYPAADYAVSAGEEEMSDDRP